MVTRLRVLFVGIVAAMLALTTVASLDRGVTAAATTLWPDWWFRATLADAYFGFITVYAWIAYKERSATARGLWLALVLCFGTMATSAYVLIQLAKLKPGEPIERLLLRSP